MAELTPKTINELPLASSLGANDLIPISSGGEAKRLPGSALVPEGGASYCKLPDGTALAWGLVSLPSRTDAGNVTVNATFPLSFISEPTVMLTWRDTNATPTFCGSLNARNVTGSGFTADAHYNQGGYGWKAAYLAVGRWK